MTKQAELKNGRLLLSSLEGRLHLTDTKSGNVYASDYLFEGVDGERTRTEASDGREFKVTVNIGNLNIEQRFVSGEDGDILEYVVLNNRGSGVFDASDFRCGFMRRTDGLHSKFRICSIPFRYSTEDGELCDYKWNIFAKKLHLYSTMRNPFYKSEASKTGGAEGWAMYEDGTVLSVSKYNEHDLEWSLIEARDERTLLYGGAGVYKLGDPEPACRIAPGESYSFGVTRYKLMDGDYREAYADYKKYIQSKGHKLPKDYKPELIWNELYNNPYWYSIPISEAFWHEDFSSYRDKMYNLNDMKREAEYAGEYSCECLYLDPGWDTSFGSNVWDERRMGKMSDFSSYIRERFNLSLALHTPLAPWSSNESYPGSMRRVAEDGTVLQNLCVVSEEYIDEKVKRLAELYKNGATFFLFDGSWYEGPCYCREHGHSVPSTRKEHCDAVREISRKLHERCPEAVIEQHDAITGPGTPRYVPVYFMNGGEGDPDEVWGFEFMNEPFEDIISRRAFALYYYNLAYSVPLYLHIDLRKDNENNMVFWWFASTCRHLGFGGLHESENVRELQKKSCRVYRENSRFFAQGEFYGIDETVHMHTLREENSTLVNCFNLDCCGHKKICRISARQAGIDIDGSAEFELDMQPFSHAAVKISWDKDASVKRII